MRRSLLFWWCIVVGTWAVGAGTPIGRQSVVERHKVVLAKADPQTILQVGNGEFAFGVDITGLQTFYGNTLSQWGWHSYPLPAGVRLTDFKLTEYEVHGRKVGYATSSKGQEAVYTWLRENPHRFNLGRIALRLQSATNSGLKADQIRQAHQELDLWRGIITSQYELEGQPVRVETCAHPELNAIAIRIESPLLAKGRLAVELAFPYGNHLVTGANWNAPEAHTTRVTRKDRQAQLDRTLDDTHYTTALAWTGAAVLREETAHVFSLAAEGTETTLEFVVAFAAEKPSGALPDFATVKAAAAAHWARFWQTGGAIDLSGSKDGRWHELERRIVQSQYLLAANEAGSLPPQESGLYNNSGWYGKFHLEMHWWHGAHYALWDRWPLFERSLGWYQKTLPAARELAEQQGYRGARWPKMVGPEGRDSPSGVGPLLIWQQPHPIFYALLDYRLHPTRATLEKWQEVVFATADFMAAYAVLDHATGKYVLGPPLKTVPENTDPLGAYNPAFELSYWRFGLREAQTWRERLGLTRTPEWDEVLRRLAPLPEQDGCYLQQEGMTNTYTKWNWEHPSLVGMLGFLPGDGANPVTTKNTVRKTWQTWQWDRKTWGWDFPLLAMGAARNGERQMAVDALLHPAARNQFNAAGLSLGGPFPYFPSNGGLLYAVAMMAAGWDGAPEKQSAPGFPDDGSWVVKWEGLKPAP
ncbi:MAG: hypothetical protein WCO56_12295 [Verrucomicrobiota bacterium]